MILEKKGGAGECPHTKGMNKQEFNEYKQKEMFKDGVKLGPSMVLSKSLEKPMYTKNAGNENVMVVGGAGSGKTRSVIIPNLLQMTGSYVVNDPGGEIYATIGNVMKEYGYHVQKYDPTKESYDPVCYIHDDADIQCFVKCILPKTDDIFWYESQKRFLFAAIYYLKDHSSDGLSFDAILKIIKAAIDKKDFLDEIFERLPKDSNAFKNYELFLTSVTEKAVNAMMIELMIVFSELLDKTIHLLHIEKMKQEKTVIFITSPVQEMIYSSNTYTKLLIAQIFHVLSKCDGKYPVMFILNEFESLGCIPDIEFNMMLGKKFRLSYITICMSLELLESIYENDSKKIIENCSTLINLGCIYDSKTTEFFDKIIDQSDEYLRKAFRTMHPNNCLVISSHHKPMIDKKYDLRKHPLYFNLPEYKN